MSNENNIVKTYHYWVCGICLQCVLVCIFVVVMVACLIIRISLTIFYSAYRLDLFVVLATLKKGARVPMHTGCSRDWRESRWDYLPNSNDMLATELTTYEFNLNRMYA